MKILGIAGSPRRQGNSDRLLRYAMNALDQCGLTTETVNIRDLNYSPCQGCNACSRDGKCVQRDDIQILQQKLLEADRIIVAAPIFFMGINAQLKAVIDRMQPYWALKYVLKQPLFEEGAQPERSGLFLSAAGTHFPDVFDCAERSVKNLFHVLNIKYSGACLYRGIDKVGDIDRHPDAAREVAEAALRLVGK